uniref:Uncharacterized protein n=1 Tax=Peronospora matthiolae TaxID=2874970 RepID=A0AAV1U5C3_9STRA
MRLASSILLISTAVVTCSVISAIALRSEAENGGEKPVKRFPKTSDTTDNEDRMISMPNLAATRAGEFLAPKGEVMLGYTGPDYRPALVKSLKQFEDGADVRVSEILAYQHPKISGADVQASEIHANQDPKISGRPVMEEGGAARNGASIEPTGQELDTRKKLEVRRN